MLYTDYLEYVKSSLEFIKEHGELPVDANKFIFDINVIATYICLSHEQYKLDDEKVEILDYTLQIANIIYENTDFVVMDDDLYDSLVEIYRDYHKSFPIGAENVQFSAPKKEMLHRVGRNTSNKKNMLKYNTLNTEDMLFYDDLSKENKLTPLDCMKQTYEFNGEISKRVKNIDQEYPELVGTLDKCKFVLNKQAIDKGVFNEDNVKVFERDFLAKHLEQGIIDQNTPFTLVCELKYDGVSIAATIVNGNTIAYANTRGDVNKGLSADLSPIFKGYKFPYAEERPGMEPFGMKFEAVMTKYNLYKYNQMKGRSYANGRTAIIGLLSSSDAHLYRDLITLIPIQMTGAMNVDRVTELNALNEFFRNPYINKFSVIYGNYMSVLFQVKRFVEEAEMMRDFIDYMYDGVVVSYVNPEIRNLLGRENSVNKYSMAIKFTPLKKLTQFLGYSYTVGQDGTITPMIHFNPVVFFGTIHDKASGHSFARFNELGLRYNDMIEVEYTNDVMAYVTKPSNSYNDQNVNINSLCEFPTHCPSCGSELIISESGKNVKCPNLDCPERNVARVNSMFKKLNIKDFSDANIMKIGRYHLLELVNLSKEEISFLGEVNAQKFVDAMEELKSKEIYDYKIMGALGFTNVATEKWKLILKEFTIHELLQMYNEGGEDLLRVNIVNIKGIGPETANTIVNELPFFGKDISLILVMENVKSIKADLVNLNIKKIRFTGCRDSELIEFLSNKGHDITGGSITKDTDILLVPDPYYESSKTKKALTNGIEIIPIDEFKSNMDYYLNR